MQAPSASAPGNASAVAGYPAATCPLRQDEPVDCRIWRRGGVWWSQVTFLEESGEQRHIDCSLHTRDVHEARRRVSWLYHQLRG
ncbi:MAG: hypothetical protein AAF191_17205 [Verrucomicrobiota bacterium]